ncbi:MAG: DMT family transporter [Victivallales bacterium]|nr:DMT family transporter [Victivallales bacterium]
MTHHNTIKGISLGLAATFIWGMFYPLSRLLFGYEEDSVEPLNFSALRFILAAIVMAPVLFKRENRVKAVDMVRTEWKVLLLLGLVGMVGEGVLVFWSIKYTTASRSSLMANTSPITTFLISWLVGREACTRGKFAGMVLGFAGVLILFLCKGEDMFAQNASMLTGDLMAFASGVCWAVFTVYGDRVSNKYGGLLCTEVLFLIAVAIVVPMAMIWNKGLNFSLSARAWTGALYLGALSYGLAEGLWYMALKYVSPGELGALGYVSAALAVVSSVLLLHEKVTVFAIVAIVLIVIGVGLMLRQSESKPKE